MQVAPIFADSGATITSLLMARLKEEPEAEWCRLVANDGEPQVVTFGKLMERVYAFARVFNPATDKREKIGICLDHGLDLHAAFIGAMWAGHVPMLLPPPSPRMAPDKYNRSICHTLSCVKPEKVVLATEVLERLKSTTTEDFSEVELINCASAEVTQPIAPVCVDPDDVAFIQHSSGTTGMQKGVALSHRAVVFHHYAYAERLNMTTEDVIVSWLPLYHDMGLIACFLLPLSGRMRLVQMSPFDWVMKPMMLFDQITREKATLCWLPNFAYSFLAQNAPNQRDGFNLGSIRAWVNCSEPVFDHSHQEFLDAFSDLNVQEGQLTASYAMAENVFAVTQSCPGAITSIRVNREILTDEHRVVETHDPTGRKLVSNGIVLHGTDIRVLDDNDEPVAEGIVGQLALKGATLFSGYYGRDDLTAAAITADGWYRTGDLGFILRDELFVTGRKNDLIILQGKNLYPGDIEDTIGRVPGVAPGRVVCFGLVDEKAGTEKLVVLAEPSPDFTGNDKILSLTIRKVIAQELDTTASHVMIVPTRSLIKSSSGKMARNDNREMYLAGRV